MKKNKASIDIGSNSCLLLIAEVEEGKVKNVIQSKSIVTSLGKDLDVNKSFIQESMDETYQALKDYVLEAEKNDIKPTEIIATATEASRVAKNADVFFEKIKNELGLIVKKITSDGEAYYSALGVLLDSYIFPNPLFILDIGGASTEIIKLDANKKEITSSFSMPVGSVRLTKWNTGGIGGMKLDEIKNNFSKSLSASKTDFLCCVAGTATSIANMYLEKKDFIEEEVHGLVLSNEDIQKIYNKIEKFSIDELLGFYPFLGKRAFTIKAGLELILYLVKELEVKKIYISTYGLRYGTLIQNQIEEKFIFT